MMQVIMLTGWICLLLASLGCSQNFSEETPAEAIKARGMQRVAQTAPAAKPKVTMAGDRESLDGINVAVPEGWRKVAPSSSMRIAEYQMSGKGEDAVLAIFAGKMGTVDANISRWIGQFEPADGEPRRWIRHIDGMPATLIDVSGTFAPGAMGRPQAAEPKSGYRMVGAIVDYGTKFYYFKLTGPSNTVGMWAPVFEEFIGGIKKD